MPQKIITILLVLFLASCASKIGNPKTVNLYKKSIDNSASIDEIKKTYGQYSDFWEDEKGHNIYQYSYTKSKYDLVSYMPIINHFGFIKSENYEVILVMNKNNLLLEKISFHDRALSRNSLVCNPLIYSCLRKINL